MSAHRDRAPVYGIDAIRFVAAAVVVLYHFSAKPFLAGEESTLHAIVEPGHVAPQGAVWWGWVGVQVFFVISGAVIGFSARDATARSFAISRVTRLWPAMLVCAALVALLNVAFWGHGPGREIALLGRSLVFWPLAPWVTGQIWTLPIEIAFYVVVWLLIAARRRASLGPLAAVLGILSGGFWLAWGAGLAQEFPLMPLLLVRHGIYFALGIVLMAGGTRGFSPPRLAMAALCACAAWFEISDTLHAEWPDATVSALLPFAAWAAATLATAISIAARARIAQWTERGGGRSAAALRTAGLMTYPLYLVHLQPGGLVLAALLWRGAPVWVAVIPACLFSLALAWIIATRIEPRIARPLRRLLDGVVPRERAQGARVQSSSAR